VLRAPDTISRISLGLAWVAGFLVIATTLVAVAGTVAGSIFHSETVFEFAVRWIWLVAPYSNVQPAVPGLLALPLTLVQWVLVALWLGRWLRGLRPWPALVWTSLTVVGFGWIFQQLLRLVGFRFVFEGI
jgi:hypothetical protein